MVEEEQLGDHQIGEVVLDRVTRKMIRSLSRRE